MKTATELELIGEQILEQAEILKRVGECLSNDDSERHYDCSNDVVGALNVIGNAHNVLMRYW